MRFHVADCGVLLLMLAGAGCDGQSSTVAPAPAPGALVASGSPGESGLSPYAAARASFTTKLRYHGPSPQDWEPLSTPVGAQAVPYVSDGLNLTAYVSPDPGTGERLPAVLFLHGGFAFGDGDWEMAEPFRQSGFVTMLPVLRGENGQPGEFTTFYAEVNDVLAAAERLAALPYVDAEQVFVCGHSAGGTLAVLAAMASDRFRGAAAFSGCLDQQLNLDIAAFDPRDQKEIAMRSPLSFATSFQCPTRIYYGSEEDWAVQMSHETARQATAAGLDVAAQMLPGDHFSSVPRAIAQAITFFQQRLNSVD